MKYFVSSDIHSFYDEWITCLKNHGFDFQDPSHIIIICGDLFDRGDESIECFKFVQTMNNANRLIYIRGNHEDLLIDCINDLMRFTVGGHHLSNGTLKTIYHFTGIDEFSLLSDRFDHEVLLERIQPVLDFIENYSKDFFDLGDKIFVHGWVPTTLDENGNFIVHSNYRDGDWKDARWSNGMEMHLMNLCPEDKTVVCGHFHTSWGWSVIRNKCSEWEEDAIFDPFIANGIIALDGCVALTRNVNCIVFDETGKLISN